MRRLPIVLPVLLLIAACGSSGGGTGTSVAAGDSTTIADPPITRAGDTAHVQLEGGPDVQVEIVEPDGYVPGAEAPVLLAFPPGGQDADTTRRVLDRVWRDEARRRGWVVLSPVAPGALWYEPSSAAWVPQLVGALTAIWPPEGGTVHLAGVSNGGLSAFRAALDHPELYRDLLTFPGYPPSPDDDVARLKDLPVAIWVGELDSGWRQEGERTVAALRALGGSAKITVVPGESHILESVGGKEYLDFLERQRPAGAGS